MTDDSDFAQLRAARYAKLGTELLKASAHYHAVAMATGSHPARAEADLLERAAYAMRAASRHPTRYDIPPATDALTDSRPCPEWVQDGLLYLDTAAGLS